MYKTKTLTLALNNDKLYVEVEMTPKQIGKQRRNRRYYLKKKRSLKNISGNESNLTFPDYYKKLTLSEFMIFIAVRDSKQIHSLTTLVSNTCLSVRTIRSSANNLEKMGYISQKKYGKDKILTLKELQ
jgi:hypothetical protein